MNTRNLGRNDVQTQSAPRGHRAGRIGVLSLLLSQGILAQEVSYEVLHKFNPFPLGTELSSTLVQGADGSLYGTTRAGGANNLGTIVKLDPDGILTTVLHSFDGTDGANPEAGLTPGPGGSFYGTTTVGGTIFRLDPDGVLTTLHAGIARIGEASLTLGHDGCLYGTTHGSPWCSPCPGTVFKLDTGGNLTTIHTFEDDGSGPPFEGYGPTASLAQGPSENLYGTTPDGGANDLGTIFMLDPNGALTTFHSFQGSDGIAPVAALTPGSDGHLYGTTLLGGANGFGTIFELDGDGALQTLHSFEGSDGAWALGGLTVGLDGSLYGTTSRGGANDLGTIFNFDANGVLTTSTLLMEPMGRPIPKEVSY